MDEQPAKTETFLEEDKRLRALEERETALLRNAIASARSDSRFKDMTDEQIGRILFMMKALRSARPSEY